MHAFVYWVPREDFEDFKSNLERADYDFVASRLTPCETMRVKDGTIMYASPEVFSRMCTRQGSWYRASHRAGQYLALCKQRLPGHAEAFLDAEINESDFQPEVLPSAEELEELVGSIDYSETKPEAWEKKTLVDAVMVKLFFTAIGAWSLRDTLGKHWLTHRANHANFLAGKVTTAIDGEDVPYSISENAGVCSSCVEFFNLVASDKRKLVRACPGAMTFGGAKGQVFLDVKPIGSH